MIRLPTPACGRSRTLLLALAVLAATPALAVAAPPPGYCEVQVCNKLERFTLNPWTAMKDSFGEICQPALVGKADAVAGKELSSESRWYQGSFNPTKRAVVRVKSVGACSPAADEPDKAPPAKESAKSPATPRAAPATAPKK